MLSITFVKLMTLVSEVIWNSGENKPAVPEDLHAHLKSGESPEAELE